MTREEKIAAFTMRIDGESWYAIAAKLGRNVADARGMIIDALRIKRIENSTRERGRIVYPAVKEYIMRNHTTIRDIMRKMGYLTTCPHIYDILYGYSTPRRKTLVRLSEATGIPIERLVREEEPHANYP